MVYYGLTLNVGSLSGDLYINFLVSASVEPLAYVACLLLLDRIGRKVMHAGGMILGGAACLCTIFTVLYADKCKYRNGSLAKLCIGIIIYQYSRLFTVYDDRITTKLFYNILDHVDLRSGSNSK
jgi:hypothetical protein